METESTAAPWNGTKRQHAIHRDVGCGPATAETARMKQHAKATFGALLEIMTNERFALKQYPAATSHAPYCQ